MIRCFFFLIEDMVEPDAMPGNTTFVAGFVQGKFNFSLPTPSYTSPIHEYQTNNNIPTTHSFIANVGDTSPNTLGAFCESPGEPWDGQPCEFEHSTCGNATEDCHGRGPGFRTSDFESNKIIGGLQMQGAQTVMNAANRTMIGGGLGGGTVRSVHVYLNMSFHEFGLPNGTVVQTCPPALGMFLGFSLFLSPYLLFF